MPNAYTTVTHQSYGERLSSSLIVSLMGIILFFSAFPILFWNEGHSVHRAQALEEGEKIVVPIDMNNVLENNNGKLVHLSGRATTDEVLTDIEFGVEVASVIKLRRVVEMYQWEESANSETEGHWGGDTTTTTEYKYSQIWSANLIKSNTFHQSESYHNPSEMPINGETFTAQQVTLGEFNLSNSLIGRINKYRDLLLSENMQGQVLKKISPELGTYFSAPYFYVGENPSKDHQIGDLRIKFEVVQPTTISVVAEQQVGARLTAYMTQVDEPLELFYYDTVTAEEMFKREKEANVMKTWFIRLGGFFMMFIGILMVLSVLTILASIVPFLGKFVGVLSAIASFFIAAIFSLITIGIAWLFYRPLLSVILFTIAGVFLYLLKFMRKKPQQIMTPEMGIIPQQPMGMVPQQLAGMVPQQLAGMVPQQAVIAQPMRVPQQQAVAPQPPMGMIPQQQAVVPQQAVIAQPMLIPQPPMGVIPQQQAVVPQQVAMVPQQQAVAHQQVAMVPQQQAVAPQQVVMVPQQQAVAPQQVVMVPQQQAVAPQQVVMVPQQQAVAPQQVVMVPQQQAVAPQQVVMVPQQQAVAPQPTLFQTLGNNSLMQTGQNEGTGLAFETVVPQKV